jgi:hypothetical protein
VFAAAAVSHEHPSELSNRKRFLPFKRAADRAELQVVRDLEVFDAQLDLL